MAELLCIYLKNVFETNIEGERRFNVPNKKKLLVILGYITDHSPTPFVILGFQMSKRMDPLSSGFPIFRIPIS
jgi:hypothetical protein